MTLADLDSEACYRALQTRDARFDGRFFTAVRTTGIFCRPVCPARTPKQENCIFLPTAAAAHQMGFRPCLRCRPETAPGVAAWRGSANTVARALHLIAEGALDQNGVDDLAARLGVGDRHLRRLFDKYVGASPISVAQAHRLLFAKQLITDTRLPMTEIALAAGYASVRRFNDAFREAYDRSPSELRRSSAGADAGDKLMLKLPYSAPYDWDAILGFLSLRAIPGVEQVKDGAYRRTFALGEARGVFEIRPARGEKALALTVQTSDISALAAIVARVRRLFDLDADIAAIDGHLSQDPLLARWIEERPGVRVPGAWDGFELAVRAILGQQVTVIGARTLAGRLTDTVGEPLAATAGADESLTHLFPTAEQVAAIDPIGIGLTRTRAATLRGIAQAMADDPRLLRAYETLEETVAKLEALPGVGAWTAHYIAMRALREPDAFPASDLGLLRALETAEGRPSPKDLLQRAEAWRPWRAYAAMRLWLQGDQTPAPRRKPQNQS
ncbi:MAG: DNA-3-methyladenine glycosylase 2 family protein [Caulobacteraceae bacterium]|nr:DNA-3-methyladenine glycosylase 2 family protein [Caulobacteraceae bacterium]